MSVHRIVVASLIGHFIGVKRGSNVIDGVVLYDSCAGVSRPTRKNL
jgi:hypothetical protein